MNESSYSSQSSKDALRDQAQQVKEDVREMGRLAKQAATDQVERARDRGLELEDQVLDYVRAQPLKSVLIAAGVGVVLGFVWRR